MVVVGYGPCMEEHSEGDGRNSRQGRCSLNTVVGAGKLEVGVGRWRKRRNKVEKETEEGGERDGGRWCEQTGGRNGKMEV
ncbi:hypothetical protein Pmani_025865 [Petrolisthes manimaculis]|uniref:Uncharacterized protein n=1 Tax=Petrolisthes manimaculis TaxID=1843537 RepID=A0AAE1U0R0_9EUCA|nr:hypothetical protein Pmani_025865 [Petrolisthes manimaculis]